MPSQELAGVNEVLRALRFDTMTLDQQRAAVEASAGSLPPGTTVTATDLGGVPGEWITVGPAAPKRTIVALRGGGYCLGSLVSNRRFCSLLADIGSARVLNVGYRNAPEHRYPAALDDAVGAYRWLLRTGTDPLDVVLAGNSAGGGLVLATLLALRDHGDPLPAGAVALSPWTDLAVTGASIRSNAATEVMLDPSGVLDTALLYADADQLHHPYVSPLYGDPTGLPPLLVQVSDTEILLDDSRRFVDSARRVGIDTTMTVVEGVPHVWHLFAGLLPEADESLLEIGLWLEELSPVR
jgi:epsilon-lactone hydrolase